MKPIKALIAVVTILVSYEAASIADDLIPALPKSLWEQQSGGLRLALIFVTKTESNIENSTLIIYLANMSDSAKEFDPDSFARGVEILDTSAGGNWHSLRTVDPFALTRSATAFIKPGQTISCAVELTPAEAKLIRSDFARLHLAMSDNGKKQVFNIESAPRQLIETVIK